MKTYLKSNPITPLLLGLTLSHFLYLQLVYFGYATSSQAIFDMGGLYGRAILIDNEQFWRLFSPIFVHIGWEHLLMNAISLYFVGQMAERVWGSWRFLLLYLWSGFMGNSISFFFHPDVLSAGASTSLFGLFASFIVIGYYGNNPFLKQLGRSYQFLIGMNLFFNIFMSDVDMMGHLGGALGGILLAVILPTKQEPRMFSFGQRSLALGVYVLLAIVLVGLPLFLAWR